mmetsp:Transcript_63919/g.73314  ORF Transcript_63919/g.73314 Transcript_63919/m.73314 type:complete len:305 (-) Transcript_63919:242-1156(-)
MHGSMDTKLTITSNFEFTKPTLGDHEERQVPCQHPGCGKMFKSRYTLRRHMLTHQEVKKHKCTFCDKRFALKQYLKEHLNIHTGETPFQCTHPGCGKRFKQAGKLSMHKKVHMLESLQKELESSTRELAEMQSQVKRPIQTRLPSNNVTATTTTAGNFIQNQNIHFSPQRTALNTTTTTVNNMLPGIKMPSNSINFGDHSGNILLNNVTFLDPASGISGDKVSSGSMSTMTGVGHPNGNFGGHAFRQPMKMAVANQVQFLPQTGMEQHVGSSLPMIFPNMNFQHQSGSEVNPLDRIASSLPSWG